MIIFACCYKVAIRPGFHSLKFTTVMKINKKLYALKHSECWKELETVYLH